LDKVSEAKSKMSVQSTPATANHLSEILPSTKADVATILIVEDDAPIRRMLNAILRRHYQVVEAIEATQAIKLAEATCPDLVLLDLTLEGYGNGLDVCRALRRDPDPVLSQTPILVLTGETTQPVISTALAAGATGYIGKPYSPQTLLDTIMTLLANKDNIASV
jgi:CheY-like chemotaxis protein